MSASFVVVLDANVLFPIALCDTLLRAAHAALYRPHWTRTILDEVERNLVAHERTTAPLARRRRQAMETAFPRALVTGHEDLIPTMTNDPKDRHVLAAAVRVGAQVIVTENRRDFPSAALAPYEIAAQSADTFLQYLHDMEPVVMEQVIRRQAADLRRPPQSVEQVLARLHRHVPGFAKAMVRQ